MCNLYSHHSNLRAITDLVGTLRNGAGNLAPQDGIYPDYPARIVRTGEDGEREFVMARWGMSPSAITVGQDADVSAVLEIISFSQGASPPPTCFVPRWRCVRPA